MTTITVPPAIAEPEEPEGDVGRANDLAAVLHGMAGRFEEFSQMAHNLRDPSAWWALSCRHRVHDRDRPARQRP